MMVRTRIAYTQAPSVEVEVEVEATDPEEVQDEARAAARRWSRKFYPKDPIARVEVLG